MISVSAKTLAVAQKSNEENFAFVFTDAAEPVVRRLPCLNQVSQLPGFGAGTVNRVISFPGIKEISDSRNIQNSEPGTIAHTDTAALSAFIFNRNSHRQPPMLIR